MMRFPEGLTERTFVEQYWQNQSLILKQGLSQAIGVVDKTSLLELSLSDEVESRLITLLGDEYELFDGPQNANQLHSLSAEDTWTLLVQSVNLWSTEVAGLLKYFQFIPHWRFDDIMISYATDQGGVGPHTDEYDVFLVQVSGKRRWRVGQSGMPVTTIHTACGLKQIRPFDAEIDTVLDPGDVLYIPPGTPHEGISIGECLTLSVGFRAPSLSEFSMMLGEELLDCNSYYRDPKQLSAETSFEIPGSALKQAEHWFKEGLNANSIHKAFAKLQTQPKQELLLEPVTDVMDWLNTGHSVTSDPAGRIAWYQASDALHVFANGEEIQLSADAKNMLTVICQSDQIDLTTISAYIENVDTTTLMEFLTDVGYLGIMEDQDD